MNQLHVKDKKSYESSQEMSKEMTVLRGVVYKMKEKGPIIMHITLRHTLVDVDEQMIPSYKYLPRKSD